MWVESLCEKTAGAWPRERFVVRARSRPGAPEPQRSSSEQEHEPATARQQSATSDALRCDRRQPNCCGRGGATAGCGDGVEHVHDLQRRLGPIRGTLREAIPHQCGQHRRYGRAAALDRLGLFDHVSRKYSLRASVPQTAGYPVSISYATTPRA